jgi:hypothetical protein
MSRYREVTLSCDSMYVNKIPLFMSISVDIKFGTAEMLKSESAVQLMASIKLVTQTYVTRGFRVTSMMVDGQFEPLRASWRGLALLLTASLGTSMSRRSSDTSEQSRSTRAVSTTSCPSRKFPHESPSKWSTLAIFGLTCSGRPTACRRR